MPKRTFRARVFNLSDASDCAEYEALMQHVADKDGTIELADDKRANWDKVGNYMVALEYFELEDD